MKSLFHYLSPYKKECVFAPLFKMLEAAFELLVPLVVASIIDIGIAGSDRSYILSRGALLFVLALIGTAAAITAQWFAAKAATGFSTTLRMELFSHIQKLSFSQLDAAGTGTLITRVVSDVNQTQNMVNLFLRLFLRSPFIVFGAMIMAFTVDPEGALVFAVLIALLFLVVFLIMRRTLPMHKKVQMNLDTLTVSSREALSGARVIRAFRRDKEEQRNFEEKNDALRRLQLLTGKISALTNPVTCVLINAAVIVILYVGGVRVNTGALTQGQVVALVNYLAQILVELLKIANLIVTMTKGLASADRIAEIFATEPPQRNTGSADEAERKGAADIRFENVCFRYPGASGDTLSGITFSAAPGETIGIIGGTGSGKSTLAWMIPGHYDATEGSIRIDGTDVRTLDLSACRSRIGMVPQKAVLFEGTVRDNLRFGKEDATDEEIWEALTAAQAVDFVKKKEGGLDFHIEEHGVNLSGGQRQRLTIARALIRKPDILILDDSMSALDFATEKAVRSAISAITPRPTTILVSQRVHTLTGCDKIVVLSDGEMAGCGTHKELLSTCSVYKEIYYSQTEDPDEA